MLDVLLFLERKVATVGRCTLLCSSGSCGILNQEAFGMSRSFETATQIKIVINVNQYYDIKI